MFYTSVPRPFSSALEVCVQPRKGTRDLNKCRHAPQERFPAVTKVTGSLPHTLTSLNHKVGDLRCTRPLSARSFRHLTLFWLLYFPTCISLPIYQLIDLCPSLIITLSIFFCSSSYLPSVCQSIQPSIRDFCLFRACFLAPRTDATGSITLLKQGNE